MQNNGHYAVQGQSESFKVTDFCANRQPMRDFLIVMNTNLRPISHRSQVIADYLSNFAFNGGGTSV